MLRRAVFRGFVRQDHAAFVEDGLLRGFSLGISPSSLASSGKRVFRNYPSSLLARVAVTSAISSRLAHYKSLKLGAWSSVRAVLDARGLNYFVFPMGATPKPHEPTVMRPTSDHTRSGLNALTVLGLMEHTLNTFKEVAWLLKQGYFMYVSDVVDAFLLIPLAPHLWFYFLFRWFDSDTSSVDDVAFAHLFGDFGTRALPGTFYVFWSSVSFQWHKVSWF